MTVKELIERLQKIDPDRIVVKLDEMSCHYYRPVVGVDDGTAITYNPNL